MEPQVPLTVTRIGTVVDHEPRKGMVSIKPHGAASDRGRYRDRGGGIQA